MVILLHQSGTSEVRFFQGLKKIILHLPAGSLLIRCWMAAICFSQLLFQETFARAVYLRLHPVLTKICRDEFFIQRIIRQGNGHGHHPGQYDQSQVNYRDMMNIFIQVLQI
jgi:hypothetical protein